MTALTECGADHVVVTGDLTHQGCARSTVGLIFAAARTWAAAFTFIPGNHDRPATTWGVELAGLAVRTVRCPGIYFVCVDSTGEHNRNYFASHGTFLLRHGGRVSAR